MLWVYEKVWKHAQLYWSAGSLIPAGPERKPTYVAHVFPFNMWMYTTSEPRLVVTCGAMVDEHLARYAINQLWKMDFTIY